VRCRHWITGMTTFLVIGWANNCQAQPYAELDTGGLVSSIAFSRGGSTLAAVVHNPTEVVMVWNLIGPKRTHVLTKEFYLPGSMWFPDGNTLIVAYSVPKEKGGFKTRLVKWNLTKGTIDEEADVTETIGISAISPDGKRLVSMGSYPSLIYKVRDRVTFEEIRTLEATDKGDATVIGARFSANGKRLVTVGAPGTIKVWDTDTWMELAKFKVTYQPERWTVAPKGDLVVVALQPRTPGQFPFYEAFDVATGKAGEQLKGLFNQLGWGIPMAFSPDGKILAAPKTVKDQLYMLLWDVANDREVGRIQLKTQRRGWPGFQFSPDGRSIVTWHNLGDGGICLWAVPELKEKK